MFNYNYMFLEYQNDNFWLRFEIIDKPVIIAGGLGLNSRSIEALDQNGNSILPELPYETAMERMGLRKLDDGLIFSS